MRLFSNTDPSKIEAALLDLGCKVPLSESATATISTRLVHDRLNNGIFKHPSIDLEALFIRSRETGNPLSFDESNTITELVDDLKTDIEALRAGILASDPDAMDANPNMLIENCSSLLQRNNQVKLGEYILFPPKYLPYDILEQIFHLCWEAIEEHFDYWARLPFATVCHRWRTVALSMPVLWNSMTAYINHPSYIDGFKRVFPRTSSPSVAVHAMRMSEPPGTTEEWLRFVSESGVQFPRLSFFLERRGVSIDDVFCPLAQHHCKELEELVFLDEYKISLSTPLSELMPRLQRLYLHSIPDAWNPSTEIPTTFPVFPHLTLLHFTSEIPWETLDIILPQCPQLQKLSVTLSSRLKEPASATHLNTSPNSHEHLTYLALSTDHGMVIIPDNFLHNWTFPNLRMLDYQLDDSETPPWVLSHPLISTVSRLVLVRRDACGGYENEETLPAILRVAHSVEELGLACLDVGGDASVLKDTIKIITSIASSPSHSRLVESLKRLHFMGLDDTPAVLNACQGQLQELCEAWSRHLDQVVLRFKDLSDTANDSGVEELFAEMKAGAKAGVSAEEIPMEVEILLFWEYIGLPLVPIGFQMWPLDFDRQTPLFKVLQEDGSWKERRGSAYHIA